MVPTSLVNIQAFRTPRSDESVCECVGGGDCVRVRAHGASALNKVTESSLALPKGSERSRSVYTRFSSVGGHPRGVRAYVRVCARASMCLCVFTCVGGGEW